MTRTGYFNDFNDELVIIDGVSDCGEKGKFLANDLSDRPSISPLFFYKKDFKTEDIIKEIPTMSFPFGEYVKGE